MHDLSVRAAGFAGYQRTELVRRNTPTESAERSLVTASVPAHVDTMVPVGIVPHRGGAGGHTMVSVGIAPHLDPDSHEQKIIVEEVPDLSRQSQRDKGSRETSSVPQFQQIDTRKAHQNDSDTKLAGDGVSTTPR